MSFEYHNLRSEPQPHHPMTSLRKLSLKDYRENRNVYHPG